MKQAWQIIKSLLFYIILTGTIGCDVFPIVLDDLLLAENP